MRGRGRVCVCLYLMLKVVQALRQLHIVASHSLVKRGEFVRVDGYTRWKTTTDSLRPSSPKQTPPPPSHINTL